MKFSFNRLVTQGLKTWEQHPSFAWVLSILWLLLIGWLAFFWNLGSTGLIDETEPLFAEASRQMTVTGDWITPYFNGETRFDKPPLIYWCQAIAYRTFGVNEFATRLPSALAGLALTSFCFYTLLYFGSPTRKAPQKERAAAGESESKGEFQEYQISSLDQTSPPHPLTPSPPHPLILSPPHPLTPSSSHPLTPSPPHPLTPSLQWHSWLVASLGAAMVALNPQTLFFGRTGYSDMLLSACMGGALLAFFQGYAQGDVTDTEQGEESNLSPLTSRLLPSSVWYLAFYVLLALAVLTKGPVGVVLPGLIIGSFLLYVGRAREVLKEMRLIRGGLIVLALSLPWYILVTLRNGEAYIDAFFGYHNFERFTSVVNQHQGPWYFHILVFLIGFTPWSIALPAAITQTKFFQRRNWQKSPRRDHLGLFSRFWFLIILCFFTIAATKYFSYTLPLIPAAAILLAIWWSEQIVKVQIFHQYPDRLKLISLLSILFFLVLAGACFYSPNWLGNDPSMPNLGLRIKQAGLFEIGAAIWGVSAIAPIVLLLRRQTHWLWGVHFLGFVAFLMFVIMPAASIIDAERQLPLRQIAQSVVQVETPGEKLVMIADGFEKPSLVFYTQRPITFFHKPSKAVDYIQKADKKSSSESVLLIATGKSIKKMGLAPNQYQEITQAGVYQLVRVSRIKVL